MTFIRLWQPSIARRSGEPWNKGKIVWQKAAFKLKVDCLWSGRRTPPIFGLQFQSSHPNLGKGLLCRDGNGL